MNNCVAEPLSRKDIRRMTEVVRMIDDSSDKLYFDILGFVEKKLPKLDPDFSFNILAIQEMGSCHGLTYPDKSEINIREDVYERACQNSGRDRLTIAHELFHLLQHGHQNISFARSGNSEVPRYMDPEWQADAFGGELLIPKRLISELTEEEIVRECKVSLKAARYQMRCK